MIRTENLYGSDGEQTLSFSIYQSDDIYLCSGASSLRRLLRRFHLAVRRILQSGDLASFYSWLQYIILYLVSILLAVLITAMLIRSRYTVTEKQIILQFGLIKSKYEIKSIYSIHLFQGSNKLALYFDDYHTKYTVVVVNRSWYDDFVKTLLERKPSIEFTFSTAEEEAAEKKK